MARAHFFETALSAGGRPIPRVVVHVYEPGTEDLISEPIYADATSGATLPNPMTGNTEGEVEFYLGSSRRVDLKWSKPGYPAETHPADVMDADVLGASGSTAVATHEAAANPHPIYTTVAEAEALVGTVTIYISDTAPENPTVNVVWIDTGG